MLDIAEEPIAGSTFSAFGSVSSWIRRRRFRDSNAIHSQQKELACSRSPSKYTIQASQSRSADDTCHRGLGCSVVSVRTFDCAVCSSGILLIVSIAIGFGA